MNSMVIFQFAFCRFTRGYTHHIPMVFSRFSSDRLGEDESKPLGGAAVLHHGRSRWTLAVGSVGTVVSDELGQVGQGIGVAQVIWFFYLVGRDWNNNNSGFPI